MYKKVAALVSLVLGVILILGSLVLPAAALSPGNVTVSAKVDLVGNLTVTPSVNFGTVTPSNQIEQLSAQQAIVQTNSADWYLSQYVSADFPGATGQKIDLSWRTNAPAPNTAAYTPMGVGSSNSYSFPKETIGTYSKTYTLDYAISVPWTVAPGSYSANVVYTLSAL